MCFNLKVHLIFCTNVDLTISLKCITEVAPNCIFNIMRSLVTLHVPAERTNMRIQKMLSKYVSLRIRKYMLCNSKCGLFFGKKKWFV